VSLGTTPATRRHKVRLWCICIHRDRPPFREWSFVSTNPELDGRFLHDRSADFGSVTWPSLGSTPATRRYRVRLWRIGIHGVRHPSKSGLLSLTILNSMAVSSTTALPILNLSPRSHWAQCQLHAGIGYIPIALIPREIAHPSDSGLLSLLILNSMADSSTTAEQILIPLLGCHWAQRQLHTGRKRVLRCPFSM